MKDKIGFCGKCPFCGSECLSGSRKTECWKCEKPFFHKQDNQLSDKELKELEEYSKRFKELSEEISYG